MNIHVGNLHPTVSETELRNLFAASGKVLHVNIITDMESGVSKGFGFVEMDERKDALKAIEKLNGFGFSGQEIEVSEANARPVNENKFVTDARNKKNSQPNKGGNNKPR